jgi:hypothetical protein
MHGWHFPDVWGQGLNSLLHTQKFIVIYIMVIVQLFSFAQATHHMLESISSTKHFLNGSLCPQFRLKNTGSRSVTDFGLSGKKCLGVSSIIAQVL